MQAGCNNPHVVSRDERIGRNLAALRNGTSQAALAALMRDEGWKWSQPTVAAIEKGERGLKLAEAETLVSILGLQHMEELLERPKDDVIKAAVGRIERSLDGVIDAVLEFFDAQHLMARVLDDVADRHGLDETPDSDNKFTRYLASDPQVVLDLVAPYTPLTPESVEDAGPWVQLLARGPYGEHSARHVEKINAQAANPTE